MRSKKTVKVVKKSLEKKTQKALARAKKAEDKEFKMLMSELED